MLVERENQILNIIEKFNGNNIEFIIVGGYAVSALSVHRFSVDCDIVIQKSQIGKVEELLKSDSFKQKVKKSGFDKIYGGEFVSFIKHSDKLPVTIDLLVNGLTSRSTEATWGFNYILDTSIQTNIIGFEKTVSCKTPSKELLLATKIHAARKTDIRDIIMLSENSDKNICLEHVKRGNIVKLKNQIGSILKTLSDKNLPDSLRGVFMLQKQVDREIEHAKHFMNFIYERIEGEKMS